MKSLQVAAAPCSPMPRRAAMSRDYSLVGLTPLQIAEVYITRGEQRAKEAQRKREEAVSSGVVDASSSAVEQEAGVGVVENVDKSEDISHSTGAPSFCGKNATLIRKKKREALGFDESKKRKKRTPKFG